MRTGRIVAIRGCRPPVPGRAILPGLVNAHVHLQVPAMARARRVFPDWIRAVIQDRAGASPARHRLAARQALLDLLADGVTAVGEIDSTGESPGVLRDVPVSGRCYQELLGFDTGNSQASRLVAQRSQSGSRWCFSGLSPHAPYSVSPALFRAAVRSGQPLVVHVAEAPEEIEFLRRGRGPLRELLEDLGRLPDGYRPPGVRPVEYLAQLGVLRANTQLVHAQHATPGEVDLIRRRRASIVVCPGTIRYFRRQTPPVHVWMRKGVCVALGTDSRASNTTLSMRHEMSLARSMWPQLSDEDILAMATTNAGASLARPGCGALAVGGAANFTMIPMPPGDSWEDVLHAFVGGQVSPSAIWLRGERFRRHRFIEHAKPSS